MEQDNSYIFSDEADRYRLETQTALFSAYIRQHAHDFVGNQVSNILDLGCGEGQLSFVLKSIYPTAHLIGIDRDEKALAKARDRAKALKLDNIEFVLGDIEQGALGGPYDLIYASTILMHTRQPEQLVSKLYDNLAAGGHLWIKDFDPDVLPMLRDSAFYGGKFYRMTMLLVDSISSIGAHPYYIKDLHGWLKDKGFVNVRYDREAALTGGVSDSGRAMLAIGVGAFYSARKLISRTQGIPEDELLRMYTDIINVSVTSKEESDSFFANYIAEKPAASSEPDSGKASSA